MADLDSVDAWLYHLGDVDPERADEIAATSADLVINELDRRTRYRNS